MVVVLMSMVSQSYKIGNTTIQIIPPEITEEERNARLREIAKLVWKLWLIENLP